MLRRAVPRFSRLLPVGAVRHRVGRVEHRAARVLGLADRARRGAAAGALPLARHRGRARVRARTRGVPLPRTADRARCIVPPARDDPRRGLRADCCRSHPTGSPPSRRGDLLARFVDDVDELQNVPLRVVQPVVSAAIVLVARGRGCRVPRARIGLGGARLPRRRHRRDAARAAARGDPRRAHARPASRRAAGGDRRARAVARRARRVRRGDGRPPAHRRHRRTTGAGDSRAGGRDRRRICRDGRGRRVRGGREPRRCGAAARSRVALDGPTFAVLCLVPLAIAEVAGAIPLARVRCASRGRAPRASPDAVPVRGPGGLPVPPADPVTPPARHPTPAIELRGVRAHWPATAPAASRRRLDAPPAALEGVDLTIAPGERVLVRGASGAGKTTLAHVLVRFLDYEGSYRLGGVEASSLDPARRPPDRRAGRAASVALRRGRAPEPAVRAATPRPTTSCAACSTGSACGEWLEERGGLDAEVGERGSARVGRAGAAHRPRTRAARRLPGARARRADGERRPRACRCAPSRHHGCREPVGPLAWCSSRTRASTCGSSTGSSRSTTVASCTRRPYPSRSS